MSLVFEIHRHTSSKPWTYADLDRRQREVAANVLKGGPGRALLSEVSPVITYGRRATDQELTLSRSQIHEAGVELYETDRGGLATYHGPGQWVLFLVENLERLTGDSRGIRKAIQTLLDVATNTAREFRDDIEVREGCELGVWTSQGKLASVGVHVQQRVLLHGLAINIFPTKESFLGTRPCGLQASVDYLFPGEGSDARMLQVGEVIQLEVNRLIETSPVF